VEHVGDAYLTYERGSWLLDPYEMGMATGSTLMTRHLRAVLRRVP
jgi:hypothetical protein